MKTGIIHIYTGNGKGKTTAALGLALRARSHGLSVVWVSFHKNPERWGYREQEQLQAIGVEIAQFAKEHPFCDKDVTPEGLRNDCLEGLDHLRTLYQRDDLDLLVVDELNISVRDGYLQEQEVLDFMQARPEGLELVLTGRGATPAMCEIADLVTEMTKIKHPYDEGFQARKGIEF
ncbi:cob(I)yrinic acid a,c-diamide adenosyltransferase [Planctomycetota bacterium]